MRVISRSIIVDTTTTPHALPRPSPKNSTFRVHEVAPSEYPAFSGLGVHGGCIVCLHGVVYVLPCYCNVTWGEYEWGTKFSFHITHTDTHIADDAGGMSTFGVGTAPGKHCAQPDCNALDFLPYICYGCRATFCADHHKYDKHACSSPGAVSREVRRPTLPPGCFLCRPLHGAVGLGRRFGPPLLVASSATP